MPLSLENSVHQSDSESDEDYVPPQDDKDSDVEQSDNEDNQNEAIDEQGVNVDAEAKKRAREALWSSFQASVSNVASSSASSTVVQEPKKVKIERKYRFAGEELVEIVEVPEDSPETKKWPLWKEPLTEPSTETPIEAPAPSIPATAPSNLSEPRTQTPTPAILSSSEPPSISTSTKPPLPLPLPPIRKPCPRKPKTSLAPLPSKAKKLSTLDKSAMDWQAHIQAEQQSGSGLKDELEANRKGGVGYLDKVQFLKRVEERKGETLDALKSNKRRKL